MGDVEQPARIDDLIARSSLGTPEAVALRASVPDERAVRVVARSKEMASEPWDDQGEYDEGPESLIPPWPDDVFIGGRLVDAGYWPDGADKPPPRRPKPLARMNRTERKRWLRLIGRRPGWVPFDRSHHANPRVLVFSGQHRKGWLGGEAFARLGARIEHLHHLRSAYRSRQRSKRRAR